MIQVKNNLLFFLLLIVSTNSLTQEINPEIQKRMEYWMERNQMETVDITNLQEIWEYHLKNPLNLNTVRKEELSVLDLCNDIQMNELLEHRSKFGPFLSVYELQTLQSWDTSFIQLILPFITLVEKSDNPPITWYEITHNGKLDVLSRIVHPLKKVSKEGIIFKN